MELQESPSPLRVRAAPRHPLPHRGPLSPQGFAFPRRPGPSASRASLSFPGLPGPLWRPLPPLSSDPPVPLRFPPSPGSRRNPPPSPRYRAGSPAAQARSNPPPDPGSIPFGPPPGHLPDPAPSHSPSLSPSQPANENLRAPKGDGTKKGLSVEHIYQKKTQLEHILLRPDTYIGSVELVTQVRGEGRGAKPELPGAGERSLTSVCKAHNVCFTN